MSTTTGRTNSFHNYPRGSLHAREVIVRPSHNPKLNDNIKVSKPPPTTVINSLCSIRVLASLFCAAFIVVTAVCLLVTTFSFSISAAQDIAEQHAASLAVKAKGDVEELLNKPLAAAEGWQFAMRKGDHKLPKDDHDAHWYINNWENFVSAMKATDFGYQFAVIGFDDGNYASCVNAVNANTKQFQCSVYQWGNRSVTNVSTTYQEIYFRSNYTTISTAWGTTRYDPRTRGWYNMVDHKLNALKWSSVYLSAIPTLPIIDINAALYNESGILLGIASLTFELGVLSNFLADLVTTANTVSMLIDNEDLLLASSFSDPYLTSVDIPKPYTGTVPSNCLVSDSANDASQSIMLCRSHISTYSYSPLRQLAAERPSLVKYGQSGALRIKLESMNYFVSVIPIVTAQAEGMSWRFALFVPQNDIVGDIVRGRDIAIYISIGIVIVSIILCFIIFTLLLRPLDDVTERMYRLATLQDTEEDGSKPSRLNEIATIQGAFRVMSEELAKVKSFLPQSVLAQLYGTDAEMDQQDEHTEQQIKASENGSVASLAKRLALDSTARMDGKSHDKGSNHKPALNTGLSLHSRKVTMLAINIAAYHSHIIGGDPAAVVAASADVVAVVSQAVNEQKGVLDGFQGDKFMASFNAVTHVGSHAIAASGAALAASQAISNIIVSGRPNAKPLSMTGGVATGTAMVGNMGTHSVKRFTVIGHVVTTAGLLERLCKRYPGATTLLAGQAITEAEDVFELLTRDVVNLPSSKGPQRSRIACLMETKSVGTDEWMYVLEAGTKASRFGLLNNSFEYFMSGDCKSASSTLSRARDIFSGSGAGASCVATSSTVSLFTTLFTGNLQGETYINPQHDFYESLVAPSVQ